MATSTLTNLRVQEYYGLRQIIFWGIAMDKLSALFEGNIAYTPLLAISGIVVAIITGILIYRYPPVWLLRGISNLIVALSRIGLRGVEDVESLNRLIKFTGFQYAPEQDIFYSTMYPWQRSFGYCRLYDEGAAPFGMIFDCEPICFDYKGKKWLIEFWKGQYDLTCGAEIGVYTSRSKKKGDYFSGLFYKSASNADRLLMSFSLYKNGRELFTRAGKHWWLTGFVLGEFAEPHELTMHISITLKDYQMRDAFVASMRKAGYSAGQYHIYDTTVSFVFDKPYLPQPKTRTKATDWAIQRKNEWMCDIYKRVTRGYDTVPKKLKAVQRNAPELLTEIAGLGKNKKLFGSYIEGKKLSKR